MTSTSWPFLCLNGIQMVLFSARSTRRWMLSTVTGVRWLLELLRLARRRWQASSRAWSLRFLAWAISGSSECDVARTTSTRDFNWFILHFLTSYISISHWSYFIFTDVWDFFWQMKSVSSIATRAGSTWLRQSPFMITIDWLFPSTSGRRIALAFRTRYGELCCSFVRIRTPLSSWKGRPSCDSLLCKQNSKVSILVVWVNRKVDTARSISEDHHGAMVETAIEPTDLGKYALSFAAARCLQENISVLFTYYLAAMDSATVIRIVLIAHSPSTLRPLPLKRRGVLDEMILNNRRTNVEIRYFTVQQKHWTVTNELQSVDMKL